MNAPIVIPKELIELGDDIRYIRLKTGEHDPEERKRPKDSGWTRGTGGRFANDKALLEWVKKGHNYGYHAVGGNICIFDCDDTLYDPSLISLFDNTLTIKTGRGYHFLFKSYLPDNEKFILDSPAGHIGHILTPGMKFQTVGPNCIHPNGGRYVIVRNFPLTWIPASLIMQHISNYVSIPDETTPVEPPKIPRHISSCARLPIGDVLGLRVEDIGYPNGNIRQHGLELQGVHPFHGSSRGNKGDNYCINPTNGVWCCFRCNSGGDATMLLAVKHGVISCSEAKKGALDDQATYTKLLDIIRHGGEGQYLADKLIEYETKQKEEHFKKKDDELKCVDLSGLLNIIREKQTPIVTTDTLPDYVLSIPGVLQDVVSYYNATAAKPQPQIAVQTAIAIGAVILGRRWFTNEDNGSSMYLAVVAKSSAGKEHIKTVIERVLHASDNGKLIGPPGYTSAGGIASALFKQPNHIAIIDEFGRLLESTNKSGNSNQMDAITGMLQVYGRQTGIYSPPGYSDISNIRKSKRRRDQDEDVCLDIHRPAITILGITTPSTLYDSMSSSYISNGFFPRFVTVDSIYGRQVSRRRNLQDQRISDRLISWCYENARAHGGEGDLDNVYGPQFYPTPITVPFSEGAYDLLEAYEEEYQKYQDANEHSGLDVMWGRCRENVQRLSLIVAVSCGAYIIKAEHVSWAIAYVKFYSERMIKIVGGNVSDTNFEATKKSVFAAIEAAGKDGLTLSEISKRCRKYEGLETRMRASVIDAVVSDYGVGILPSPSQRGRRRIAYALNKYLPEEDAN
ncbi:MAG: DUF3987 domain-containing protein [Methanoregula sp.]|jgi:hypothetical protein|nr:DUF3987 domain-containing protein [Methanoregula sp.]